MRWLLILLVMMLVGAMALAANTKLYLTDGTWHTVREYQVLADRVRYFSVERSEWEEIPLTLVDLKKTQGDLAEKEASLKAEKKAEAEELQAERDLRREVRAVPTEPGLYFVLEQAKFRTLKRAELRIVSNKRRSILAKLAPIPIVSGRSTLEIDGTASATVLEADRPEFYLRLSEVERFALVRLWPGVNAKIPSRIVEKWEILPIVKEVVRERQEVEIFRKQVGDDLYKVWPMEPLAPGEYAWIQYTEGKENTQVWDFGVQRGK